MVEAALGGSLNRTQDGEGFFGYNQNYGAYIEVISFEKLLRDAKDRNRILFDRLFKPSPKNVIESSLLVQDESLIAPRNDGDK